VPEPVAHSPAESKLALSWTFSRERNRKIESYEAAQAEASDGTHARLTSIVTPHIRTGQRRAHCDPDHDKFIHKTVP